MYLSSSTKVYKLDKKYEPDGDSSYLSLPHLKQIQALRSSNKLNGGSSASFTPLPKDVFTVQTTLASTKLTQNEGWSFSKRTFWANVEGFSVIRLGILVSKVVDIL